MRSPQIKATALTIFGSVALLLSVLGLCRLYGSARSGSEELADSLHRLKAATVGHFKDIRTPAQSYPDQQLEFWSSEIDRILAQHPDDAELFAAAALMMYEPCWLYLIETDLNVRTSWMVNPDSLAFWGPGQIGGTSSGGRTVRSGFEAEGYPRSTDLIRRATELAPNDPRWWRLRAVLMWPSRESTMEYGPLVSDWERVLQEAESHDPGNALYTVLAASQHSRFGSAFTFDEDLETRIGDADAWQKAIQLAEQCVSYEKLELGEPAANGLVRLHALSEHPTFSTSESIRSRLVGDRAKDLLAFRLARNLEYMAFASELQDKPKERRKLLQLADSVCDFAIERSDAATRYSGAISLGVHIRELRVEFEAAQGASTESLEADLAELRSLQQAWWNASTTLDQQARASDSPAVVALGATALTYFVASLVGAMAGLVIWLLLGRPRPRQWRGTWVVICFALGTATSVFFLGSVSKDDVSESFQHGVLTVTTCLCLMLVIAGIAMHSRLRLRYSIRSLLLASFAAAVLIQATLYIRVGWDGMGRATESYVTPDETLEHPERYFVKWKAHRGPQWSIAFFLMFAAVGLAWSNVGRRAFSELLIGTCVWALIWFNVWVWLEPANNSRTRPERVRLETYLRSVDELYEPLETLINQELAANGKQASTSAKDAGR